MMLDETYDAVFLGQFDKFNVMFEFLDSWLCHKNVNSSLDSIFGDGVMRAYEPMSCGK